MDARGAIRKCFLRSLSSSTIAVAQQARSIAEPVPRRSGGELERFCGGEGNGG